MKLSIVLSIFLLFLLNGCSEKKEPLTITANAWIGYSPIFYAREKGWFEDTDIQLISTTSLAESMHIYNAGSANVFTGTQHEFQNQRAHVSDLVPIILFDRSNGGDAILSNVSLETILKSKKEINVYLELDSINEELLKYFTKKYSISEDRLKIQNKTQDQIVVMEADPKQLMLIITYDPYNITLTKKGFFQIADTRINEDLLVIDALYTSAQFLQQNKEDFEVLNTLIRRSLNALKSNPEEYYETVKVYLDNPTYEEFQVMIKNISWLHGPIQPETKAQLQTIDFPYKDIMQ